MMVKFGNPQIRAQFENVATGHHLVLKMVQFVITRTFSPGIKRTNILRTTSPLIAFSRQAEYFSSIPSICSKIVRRCQTSTSTQMLLWLMDQLCRVVSDQVYPGTLTHLKLELPHEICPGSSKFAMHSFQGFMLSRTFCIQADFTLHTISIFEERVTYFHCGVCMSSTHYQQSGEHVLWPWVIVRRWTVLMSKIPCLYGHGQNH